MRTRTRTFSATLARLAPFALRIVWGIIFFVHGINKLPHMGQFTERINTLGMPYPGIVAPFLAWVEIIGGIALILGVGTRLFALILGIEMLVAALAIKLPSGLVDGFEFELALFAGCLSLLLSGPGIPALTPTREHVESLPRQGVPT